MLSQGVESCRQLFPAKGPGSADSTGKRRPLVSTEQCYNSVGRIGRGLMAVLCIPGSTSVNAEVNNLGRVPH